MRAYWLNAMECSNLSTEELHREGVTYFHTPVGQHREGLDLLKAERDYVAEDEVALNATLPNFEELRFKFIQEHSHAEDEVRYVLEGNGIFDIRSQDDCWMRVLVEPGDLIIVPAGRNHLFRVTSAEGIRAIRLFKDSSGWVPNYRVRTGLESAAPS
jgi:1,2-dihydroxy-3-keto-5-methylthiopentene dioxygenase